MININSTKVFVGVIPDADEIDLSFIYPDLRRKYIEESNNTSVKKQRFYGWMLLSKKLYECYGIDISDVNIRRLDNGKWTCDEFCFSISNTDKLVAIAISDVAVGVDLQKYEPERFGDKLALRILTPNEYNKYRSLNNSAASEYANLMWTKKESIFKAFEGNVFSPSKVDCGCFHTESITVSFEDCDYFLSVCTHNDSHVTFEENIYLF